MDNSVVKRKRLSTKDIQSCDFEESSSTNSNSSSPPPQASSSKRHRGNAATKQAEAKQAEWKASVEREVRKAKNPLYQLLKANGIESPGSSCPEAPIWADLRPDLCSALPYFKGYQSGFYNHFKLVYGVLRDGFGMDNDVYTSQVVITRIGGSCQFKNGSLEPVKDQDIDKGISSYLKNTMDNKMAVVLIIGNRNPAIEFHPKARRYNVMSHFRITHIWPERYHGSCMYMVRFEKVALQEQSWWFPEEPTPTDFSIRPAKKTCGSCGKYSDQIHQEWLCLNNKCEAFWKNSDGVYAGDSLSYNPDFLNFRTNDEVFIPCSLLPVRGTSWIPQIPITVCEKMNISSNALAGFQAITKSHGIPDPKKKAKSLSVDCWNWKGFWSLDGIGSIWHVKSADEVNEQPGGPNDLFNDFQRADLGLKRLSMCASNVKGERTRHFAANFGMPYKFAARVDTKSFEDAPECVLRAMAQLDQIGQRVRELDEQSIDYDDNKERANECLVLGYMRDMKINYHDDGEKELGGEIRTLSLGGGSRMSIRLKPKYYYGCSDLGVIVEDGAIVPPGCQFEDHRRELAADLASGKIEHDEYATEFKAICGFKEGSDGELRGIKSRVRRQTPELFGTYLAHGDYIIMRGKTLQKYYEHAVTPDKDLRFAVTSRHVIPEMVSSDQR